MKRKNIDCGHFIFNIKSLEWLCLVYAINPIARHFTLLFVCFCEIMECEWNMFNFFFSFFLFVHVFLCLYQSKTFSVMWCVLSCIIHTMHTRICYGYMLHVLCLPRMDAIILYVPSSGCKWERERESDSEQNIFYSLLEYLLISNEIADNCRQSRTFGKASSNNQLQRVTPVLPHCQVVH